MKDIKKLKNAQRGITLIALVVTIVVLLILAGITINMLFSENGIITKAKQAAEKTAQAEENDIKGMQNVANEIDKIISSNTEVTNPYDPNGWYLAWTCTNGTWSNEIAAGNTIADDVDIVAKLYKTGNKITPPRIQMNITGTGVSEFEFIEGDEYKLIIEGKGEMGILMNSEDGEAPTEAYGWQYSSLLFLGGYSDTCIIPYVTEVIICDGITNIGAYAFLAGASIKEIKIGKDVKEIGRFSINTCASLENITIPNGITTIEKNAFLGCTRLKSVTIPENITRVGRAAFVKCTSLEKVKILITDTTNVTFSNDSTFYELAEESTIYVLNEEVKTMLEGSYNTSKTTVQVVTQEEMNNL